MIIQLIVNIRQRWCLVVVFIVIISVSQRACKIPPKQDVTRGLLGDWNKPQKWPQPLGVCFRLFNVILLEIPRNNCWNDLSRSVDVVLLSAVERWLCWIIWRAVEQTCAKQGVRYFTLFAFLCYYSYFHTITYVFVSPPVLLHCWL